MGIAVLTVVSQRVSKEAEDESEEGLQQDPSTNLTTPTQSKLCRVG